MKKLFLINFTLLMLTSMSSSAQLTPPAPPKPRPVKVLVSPGLESAPTRTTPLPLTNADYLLSTVKVTIKTGSDNKESLSNVTVELAVRDTNCSIFAQNNLTNELKINSENTIGLERYNAWINRTAGNISPTPYYTKPTGIKAIFLSDVLKYGLSVRIIYKPNFFADAWKIENVSATLEFRDGNGNLHATYGTKTVSFSNTSTFLDNFDKRILICTADASFNPLTSFVTNDFSKRW